MGLCEACFAKATGGSSWRSLAEPIPTNRAWNGPCLPAGRKQEKGPYTISPFFALLLSKLKWF
ncbi:MAG: hypothetical protein CVU07_11865 [Bacteroidetes bacterium HGW-Bacteroidetes-23]|nr:MAG: hypothetical protein CVU07_11865 [Bacteroidetes bacterium HGW-Bacteroidetes-23]